MRAAIVVCAAALAAGCGLENEKDGAGSLRLEIFRECMEMAAQIQSPAESLSTTESRVSDVVKACSQKAYYMANDIAKRG